MEPLTHSNSLLAAWQRTRAVRGDSPAIFSPAGEILRTFADIEAESAAIEDMIGDFPAGSVVVVQIGNSEYWPALFVALRWRNLIPLPVDRHVHPEELGDVLRICGAAAVTTVRAGRPYIEKLPGPPRRHDCDFLKLTSGTTSTPRLVRFHSGQLVADCENICETMGITDEDVNFGVIPFSHSYGFSNLVTPLICRGIAMVASEDRMPRAILDGLLRTGATVFPATPVIYDKLAALSGIAELPRLRLCISAGAPLRMAVAAAFQRSFGKKIHTFYGSSECGGIGYDASDVVLQGEGYVGRPMKGVEVIPHSGQGAQRITVRGPAVADGYFPDEGASVLGCGQFVPGDLIRWTKEGMYLEGRSTDTINIAGRKLNPGEVEARIASFPGVRQIVVFGIPSSLRGEEPIACVAGEGVDPAALRRFCLEQLSKWQAPRDFWFVPEIPVNDRGKISRRELSANYLQTKNRS